GPVLIHALETLGLDQLKDVALLVLADFQPIQLKLVLPAGLDIFEDLVVEPREVIAGDQLRLLMTWRQAPGPVISVVMANGVPAAIASLVLVVWSQKCGEMLGAILSTW